jgi:hypothetical protein
MSNKVLIKLEDTKKRKFPVVYKYIEEEISDEGAKFSNHVSISSLKNATEECVNYYKPISKLL